MNDLPADVAGALAKGVAAYVRATPASELPPPLTPLQKTAQTQKGLARRRARLLAVLEDDALRALILEWLEAAKPPLSKLEAAALKLATGRPEGWKQRLNDLSTPKKKTASSSDLSPRLRALEEKLAKEKEAHRKTKEDVRAAREDGLHKIRSERARSLRLDEEVTTLRATERDWQAEASAQTKRADRLDKTLERERRKTRADLESLREQVKELRGENRDLKKRLAEAEKAAAPETAGGSKPASKAPRALSAPAGPRPRLKAPKGRLEDDPATLDEWLSAADVRLVVDGYNVTRSRSGFGRLDLEQQRSRLREMLKALSNRRRVQVVLVWDGGEVPPGTKRMSTRYLTEEYSEPDRSVAGTDKDRADRHIVGLLRKMPAHPVVVATNDRALQQASARERATIATSDQLLALLR